VLTTQPIATPPVVQPLLRLLTAWRKYYYKRLSSAAEQVLYSKLAIQGPKSRVGRCLFIHGWVRRG